MAAKDVAAQKFNFEQEINHYEGPDPLKPRYEYILWLDTNLGKENSAATLKTVLLDTLTQFREDPRYNDDMRLVHLIAIYIENEKNPRELYEQAYHQNIGRGCAIFYKLWADFLLRSGTKDDLKAAKEVYERALENQAQPVTHLQKYYLEFHVDLSNKVLNGLLPNDNEVPLPIQLLCSRCKVDMKDSENNNKCKDKKEGRVLELNGIKTTEKRDYSCPLAYFEPPDPSKIPMYDKDKVYRDNKEYQFEELRALKYLEKYVANTVNNSNEPVKVPVAEIAPLAFDQLDAENVPQILMETERPSSAINNALNPLMPAFGPPKSAPASNSLVPINNQLSLLCQPSEQASLYTENLTVHMKEALNVVQEMWESPAPAESKRVRPRNAEDYGPLSQGRTGVSKPFSIYSETSVVGIAPPIKEEQPPSAAKSYPFEIYTDQKSFCDPPLSLSAKPQSVNSKSGHPESLPQTISATTVKQLVFEEGNGVTPLENSCQKENSVQPVFPALSNKHDQEKCVDDMTDVCTKVFAFPIPSSTPCSARNSVRNQNSADSSYTALSVEKKQPPPQHPQSNDQQQKGLSMILEASNDKQSSSTSSIGVNSNVKNHQTIDLENNMHNLLLDDSGDVDPFSSKLTAAILSKLKFPQEQNLNNYQFFSSPVPNLTKSTKLGNEIYAVQGDIGKGNYARIAKAVVGNRMCALKIEKPACIWEYYICCQIRTRIPPEKLSMYVDVKSAYFYQNGSILDTDCAKYGNLLDVINHHKIQMGKSLDTGISAFFSLQVMEAVDYLHRAQIIHADIKPDNFVLRDLPNIDRLDESCIQLIDFGRSIDMQVLPAGTKFTVTVNTDDFICNEMKEKKPWTYQTDLYGLAGTIYCLLASDYMKVVKKANTWTLLKALPRTVNRTAWDPIFNNLLNVQSCSCLPNLQVLKGPVVSILNDIPKSKQLMLFNNFASVMNRKKPSTRRTRRK